MAIIVERVAPGSLAAKAGLQAGDRLLEYADNPLASPAALLACEENAAGPGDRADCGGARRAAPGNHNSPGNVGGGEPFCLCPHRCQPGI